MELPDRQQLQAALETLYNPSLTMKIVDKVGKPIEWSIQKLPDKASANIQKVVKATMETTMDFAAGSLTPAKHKRASNWGHRFLVAGTGAAGGAFGVPALAIELPVSTGIMLRSIADIARQEGENIALPSTRMECVSVFAYGGESKSDDGDDSGYFAARMALAYEVKAASEFLAKQGTKTIQRGSAPALVRLIATLAERFGIVVTEKAIAQSVPVIGAIGGASINLMFINHYQSMAQGHFTVRRLERKYGDESIREESRNLGYPC